MQNTARISVILPCYNEEKSIGSTLKEVLRFAEKNPRFDFTFVNDGSRDKTLETLNKGLENARNSKVKVISYEKNRGKGHAVRKGVESAKGDLICFTDSDLAYSLEHLFLLENKLREFDIAIGVRGLAKSGVENVPLPRRVIGKLFNLLSRIILGLKLKDMQAGLKGFRKEAAKELFKKQKIDGWAFDTEVLYLAKKNGYRTGEIPATVSDNGSYKTSKVKVIRDSAKMFITILGIRLNDFLGRYN